MGLEKNPPGLHLASFHLLPSLSSSGPIVESILPPYLRQVQQVARGEESNSKSTSRVVCIIYPRFDVRHPEPLRGIWLVVCWIDRIWWCFEEKLTAPLLFIYKQKVQTLGRRRREVMAITRKEYKRKKQKEEKTNHITLTYYIEREKKNSSHSVRPGLFVPYFEEPLKTQPPKKQQAHFNSSERRKKERHLITISGNSKGRYPSLPSPSLPATIAH